MRQWSKAEIKENENIERIQISQQKIYQEIIGQFHMLFDLSSSLIEKLS